MSTFDSFDGTTAMSRATSPVRHFRRRWDIEMSRVARTGRD
jgi:hypothetical protein